MVPGERGAAPYAVNTSDEFERCWMTCSEPLQDAVAAHVGLLERVGPQLGRPYADTLAGTTISSLKELRVQHRGRPYRILYAFGPNREALLLFAGNEGEGKRWYPRASRAAERIWARHLAQLEDADG